MCLTANERRALTILKNKPGIPARTFAILYFGDTKSQRLLCSETEYKRNKVYYGREAWIKGAAVLCRLVKKGWVVKIEQMKPPKYRITDLGASELAAEEAA